MTKPIAFGTLLLLTSTLVAPAALAQTAGAGAGGTQSASPPSTTTVDPTAGQQQPAPTGQAAASPGEAPEEQVEISAPGVDADAGEDIVVIGRNIPEVVRATSQVVSVLSSADIARTGEGDIAGALARVTGLSVVGNGFVFVRGLGDRYSSSLLNGSPLPSPDPLRRTVPLDIFPTSIIASSLVQKSYSVNYPGEFGGGVINLTTRAIPEESFFQIGGSIAADTVTTSELGYVYDGGDLDWLGYDDGERRVPDFIRNGGLTRAFITSQEITQLSNAKTTLLQQNNQIPANVSGELSFGHSIDVGSSRFGIIASGSVSNSWRTRDNTQQDTADTAGALRSDFRTVLTDNRIVANALVGLGAEFGDHRVRLTNIYIHDTLKQARFGTATVYPNSSGDRVLQQNTNWFERQLIDTQFTGEFKFDDLAVDVRASYANTTRKSPYERFFSYRLDPNLATYVNSLNGLGESATVAFSDLNEDLYSGQVDARYTLPTARPITLSAGYFHSDTQRSSSRFDFRYRAANGGSLPSPFIFFRPDFLLSNDTVLNGCTNPGAAAGEEGCIRLFNLSGADGAAQYDASLRINAGYGQVEAELFDGLRFNAGVRYEEANEQVTTSSPQFGGTTLANDYWLPAATVTWNFAEDMQLRAHASKTISRPQFRELAPQVYRDFESDRLFFGNPALIDSQLTNYELRYEWFLGRNQRITAAGFYKDIKNPTEQISFFPNQDAPLQTGFSYAPSATLYGGEIEVQKNFPLNFIDSPFFATRRILVVANYTYTKSALQVGTEQVPFYVQNAGAQTRLVDANTLFRDGAPLTGQSDHLVNLQLGIEDTASTSQLTALFSYASDRVTTRGPSLLPDIIERPGIRLDVVGRQGFSIRGVDFELKAEARNLTGTRYQEFQDFGGGTRVDINNYRLGRVFSLGLSARL